MLPGVIVLSEPLVDDDLSLRCSRETFGVEYLAAQGPLKRSLYPFSQGYPA